MGQQDVEDGTQGLRNLVLSKPVKVIAVSAGKGSVSKSNVSINLSIALAQKGRKVLLMDADLGLANIDIMLTAPGDIKVIPAASGTNYMTLSNIKRLY